MTAKLRARVCSHSARSPCSAGLVLLVVSVRLSTPNLALFLISGALIGGGAGAVFKGTTGIVLAASPPESRLAMTSDLLIALYVGLSVPVVEPESRSAKARAHPTPCSASPSSSGSAFPSRVGR